MSEYSRVPAEDQGAAPHMLQVPQQHRARFVTRIEAHVSDVVDSISFSFSDGQQTMFGRKGGQVHRHVAFLAPGGRADEDSPEASSNLQRRESGDANDYEQPIYFTAPDGCAIVGLTPIKGRVAVVWLAPRAAAEGGAALAPSKGGVWTAVEAARAFAPASSAHQRVHVVATATGTPPLSSGTPPSWRTQSFVLPAQADDLQAAWRQAKGALQGGATVALHVDATRWTLQRCRVTRSLSGADAEEARRGALKQAQEGGLMQLHEEPESTFRRLKNALVFLSMLGGTRSEVFLVLLLALLAVVAASISSSSRVIVGQVIGLVTSASDDELQKSIAEDWAAQAVCWTPVDCDRRGGLQAALLGSYFLLRLLGGGLHVVRQRVSSEAKRARAYRLDSWLLHHLLHLPVQHFTSPDGADFAGRLSSGAVVSATWSLPQLGFTLCRIGVVLWFLVEANPWMALTAAAGVLLSKSVLALLQTHHSALTSVLVAQRLQYNTVFMDLMRNMRLVSSSGAASRCAHRADSLAQSVDVLQRQEQMVDTASAAAQLTLRYLVTCLALLVGVWWPPATSTSGDSSSAAASITAAFLLLEDFMGLSQSIHDELLALKSALPTLERFKQVATVSFGAEVHDLQGGVSLGLGGAAAGTGPRMFADDSDCSSDDEMTHGANGGAQRSAGLALRMHNVRACHPSSPWRDALQDWSCAVKPGEPCAVLCSAIQSECVLDVTMRQCDVRQGSVELGGRDISSWSPSLLRGAVAVVRACPLLLDGSVLHNVLLGCSSEHHEPLARLLAQGVEGGGMLLDKRHEGGQGGSSEAWLSMLLHKSALLKHFLEWSRGLVGGLHTQVGQGGVSLGVGERQLVTTVRCLLQQPQLLALDLTACALGDAAVQALRHDVQQGPLSACAVLVLVSSPSVASALHCQVATAGQ